MLHLIKTLSSSVSRRGREDAGFAVGAPTSNMRPLL